MLIGAHDSFELALWIDTCRQCWGTFPRNFSSLISMMLPHNAHFHLFSCGCQNLEDNASRSPFTASNPRPALMGSSTNHGTNYSPTSKPHSASFTFRSDSLAIDSLLAYALPECRYTSAFLSVGPNSRLTPIFPFVVQYTLCVDSCSISPQACIKKACERLQ